MCENRMLKSVIAWGEKKRGVSFIHGQIKISYYVQRLNQYLSPKLGNPARGARQQIFNFKNTYHRWTKLKVTMDTWLFWETVRCYISVCRQFFADNFYAD